MRQAMEQWVVNAGIGYRWEPRLGGLRKPSPESPHVALRHPGFRAYADHMATPEFVAALDEVLGEAAAQETTVMCAESLWWRCHRRLIADFASLVRGVEVRHLMHDGRLAEHRPTEGVRREGDGLAYDVATVGKGDSNLPIGGFSIMEADSKDAVTKLLDDHPHFHTPGPTAIEVLEFQPIPGS
jgi:hypothetical protein